MTETHREREMTSGEKGCFSPAKCVIINSVKTLSKEMGDPYGKDASVSSWA